MMSSELCIILDLCTKRISQKMERLSDAKNAITKIAKVCGLSHTGLMNMNVSLTDELVAFVKAKVGTGRYTSSSEVVRDALRVMEKQEEEKLAWLRQAFKQGIESGDAGELDLDALKAEGRRRLNLEKV